MLDKNLKPFPKDFFWGASTSAYQVEGANLSDGKGPSCQDVKELPAGTASLDICADHYHRFEEDIALMAEMGFKMYRFSIAWTRILPQGTGEVNQAGIDHYNKVIDCCLAHGIEPLVTMFHFDMPDALDQRGSWGNRESVDWFVEYAKVLFENFGDRVKYWLTINEQNMLTLVGPVIGTMHIPEGCTNVIKETYQQNHHMLLAQETAEAFIVTDIHLDKPVVGLILYILEIGKIARVCKFIQIDDEIVRILIDKETHYVTPDKARTARDDDDALVGLTVGHDV